MKLALTSTLLAFLAVAMSPLFLATIEATEEALYNSLFRAQTTTANGRTVEALPLDKTLEILRGYNALEGSRP